MSTLTKPVMILLMFSLLGASLGVSAQEEELAGTWQSIGYGVWFDVAEDAVNIYQVTDVSCVAMVDIPEVEYAGDSVGLKNVTIAGIGQYIGTFDYELTLEDGLLNFEVGKVNPIQAERAEALPPQCAEMTPNSPEGTFETFWNMFNEHYAFFDVRGVDWQAAYATYRPMVTAETSEEDLFAILQEMITPLGDGHVSLNSTFNSFSPVTLPAWLEGTEDESAIAEYATLPANYLIDAPQMAANDMIIYGRLSETIGYMQIVGFDGFSEDGADFEAIREAMSTILAEFAELERIVVDVRFNLGGDDTKGFFIAGHFTDEPVLIGDKSVWVEDGFSPIMDLYLEPTSEAPYLGDIYLLTSRMTISAAETFTLAMSTLPTVTIVGEPTNGMLSDSWFAVLPNGWLASLSNERYLSREGILYESVGVPSDVEVFFTAEDFATGHDPMIEAILEITQ